jgi:hypothetical protein
VLSAEGGNQGEIIVSNFYDFMKILGTICDLRLCYIHGIMEWWNDGIVGF